MMKTPSNKHIITSAPGSIMLTGEHAVVYGYNAIVCAVAQRVTVRLSRRDDDAVVIDSALSQYRAPRNALSDDVKLRFVLAAIKQAPLTCGISIHIDSAIDPTLGLGSSAAVTVATLYALAQLQQHNSDKAHIHQQALNIIRTIQGRGSGADIAASVYGGMLAYRLNPIHVERLPLPPPLSLRYCGYKTPTAEVLAQIATRMASNPPYYQSLYQTMGISADNAITAAKAQDWQTFAQALNHYQHHLDALGVSDATLHQLLAQARTHADCQAVKISGSGLGDCIVALGNTPPPAHIPVTIANTGVTNNV